MTERQIDVAIHRRVGIEKVVERVGMIVGDEPELGLLVDGRANIRRNES